MMSAFNSYLHTLATDQLFGMFLVFARLGTACMFLPGFSEDYVLSRSRLVLAGMLTLLVYPILATGGGLPAMPKSTLALTLMVANEAIVGAFMGLLVHMIFNALEVAGMIMSFQAGLGNATVFNPALASQGSILSVLLVVAGVVMIFAANLHHLMLQGIVDSYTVFAPARLPATGDMLHTMVVAMGKMFYIATQMAAPFLAIGLLFNVGLGLLGRVLPQIQTFFVALPAQIFLGMVVMSIIIAVVYVWFLSAFENSLESLLGR